MAGKVNTRNKYLGQGYTTMIHGAIGRVLPFFAGKRPWCVLSKLVCLGELVRPGKLVCLGELVRPGKLVRPRQVGAP